VSSALVKEDTIDRRPMSIYLFAYFPTKTTFPIAALPLARLAARDSLAAGKDVFFGLVWLV